jgi:hypothetical protein
MKRSLVIVALAVLVLGALSASARVSATPTSAPAHAQAPLYSPPRELVLYGHIASLKPRGRRLELRFDPAHWLGGVTANRAAVEDKVISPGESVPNDYYIREDGHRLLTYLVPAKARVTIVAYSSGQGGLSSKRITVAELARLRNKPFRPDEKFQRNLGFWIRVATDTVRSLDQQYQP